MCEICGNNSDLDICSDCEAQYPDLNDHAFKESLMGTEIGLLDADWDY